jgi:hypothetical protein
MSLSRQLKQRFGAIVCLLAGLGACFSALAIASPATAADKIPWVSGTVAAAEQARQQGRLLLVVQLSGDFTADVLSSREAKIYSSISLGEQPVVDFIRARCVATIQSASGSPLVEALVPKSSNKQDNPPPLEYAISYLCAPDGRVVHFVPGFVSADRLLKELQWADEHCRDALRFPAAEQSLAVREGHWQGLREADRKLFLAKFPTRWEDDDSPRKFSADDLTKAIDIAQAVRQTRIVQRLGGARAEDITPRMLRAMAVHADLEATTPHMILAEFPLPTLAKLQTPVYAGFTGQRPWYVSPRRSELQFWLAERLGKSKPIVLSVTGAEESPADAVKFTANAEVQRELANCETQELSLDELAALAADAKMARIAYRTGQEPRFVVLDANGKRIAVLSHHESAGRLIQVIHAGVDASRGIVRATTTEGE